MYGGGDATSTVALQALNWGFFRRGVIGDYVPTSVAAINPTLGRKFYTTPNKLKMVSTFPKIANSRNTST